VHGIVPRFSSFNTGRINHGLEAWVTLAVSPPETPIPASSRRAAACLHEAAAGVSFQDFDAMPVARLAAHDGRSVSTWHR